MAEQAKPHKGRPFGAKSRPGGKPNRLPGTSALPKQYTPAQIQAFKQGILDLIEAEEADNLTEACETLGISALRAHYWQKTDKNWAGLLQLASEIKADRLERALDESKNPIAMIFRLKKLRPEYRDTWKFNVTSESLEKLLQELREAGKKALLPPKEVEKK